MVLISPTTNPIQNALTHTHFINQFWCLRIFVRCDQSLLDETAFHKQDRGPQSLPKSICPRSMDDFLLKHSTNAKPFGDILP